MVQRSGELNNKINKYWDRFLTLNSVGTTCHNVWILSFKGCCLGGEKKPKTKQKKKPKGYFLISHNNLITSDGFSNHLLRTFSRKHSCHKYLTSIYDKNHIHFIQLDNNSVLCFLKMNVVLFSIHSGKITIRNYER